MAKSKLNLALIFGGRSAERDISVSTATQIASHLDAGKYRVVPIEILQDGRWTTSSPAVRSLMAQSPKLIGDVKQASANLIPFVDNHLCNLPAVRRRRLDVAFLALHGPFGEDGTIQGMMEMLGIRYTCSGVLASALAMDKFRTLQMVEQAGIRVPEHLLITAAQRRLAVRIVKRRLGFPCVVKPLRLGSSVGVSIVQNDSELDVAIAAALSFGPAVLVERYISGREITAAVLGNDAPMALPLIEIQPKVSHFFDYKAKYEIGGSNEICPAPIAGSLTKTIQRQAVGVHLLLGCRGITRSDFMVDRRGKPYFLEINTIPGMTQTSLVPQAARQANISFSKLLDTLLDLAMTD
ncbi:MAG: D-alanine--D-alanine ligase [Acidobacteria bacterium]|nr:D-alanine--D-alanine ligase [Acidobacteriota bacterium]